MSTPASQMQTVGKKELCALLRWSRPKLDQRLRTDPNFPVVRYGTQTGGWAFDPAAVRAYMQGAAVHATVQPDPEPVASSPNGPAAVRHRGEATARQRRDLLHALLLADRLKLARGTLIEVGPLAQEMNSAMAEFARDLDSAVDTFVRRAELQAPHYAVLLREVLGDCRREFVERMRRRANLPLDSSATREG